MHNSRGMGEARKRNPFHTGAAEEIRRALQTHGPLSAYMLFMKTGIEPERIKRALSDLLLRSGGIVASPGTKGTIYSLYQAPKPAAGSGQIAGKITIPQFRWNGTRLG